MRRKAIEGNLRSALFKLSGTAGAEILARCRAAEPVSTDGSETAGDLPRPVLEKRSATRPRRAAQLIRIGAAAAVLVLVAGAFILLQWRRPQPVRACVYLDVNPGLEIDVGDRDEVLGIRGTNADGIRLAGAIGQLPAGESIETAYRALIGRLASDGYLTETYNSILISVQSADDNRAERLQASLIRQTGIALSDQNWQPAVLAQRLPAGTEPGRDMVGDSPGRRALTQLLLARYPDLSAADLAPLKINDLNILLDRAETAYPDLTRVGTASEKAYIGRAAALSRLRQHPDFAGNRMDSPAVSFDCEDGRMVYEVEWTEHGTAYEVRLDALTGQILSQQAERVDSDSDGDGETDDDASEYDSEDTGSDPERADGRGDDLEDEDRTADSEDAGSDPDDNGSDPDDDGSDPDDDDSD